MTISIAEAKKLIDNLRDYEISLGRDPNTWYTYENHVYGTAKIAQIIASELDNIDSDKAFVGGLLHDICRIQEEREKRFHGILGYEKLCKKDKNAARACLLHMFPLCKLEPYEFYAEKFYNRKEDYMFIADFIEKSPPRDEDYLIQLCDNLANKNGPVTVEERAAEIFERRQNFDVNDMINKTLELKLYFEKKIGHNIYDFFKVIKNID